MTFTTTHDPAVQPILLAMAMFHVQPIQPVFVVAEPADDLSWLDRYAEDCAAESGYQEDT